MSSTAVKNLPQKVKPLAKRVRFNLEGNTAKPQTQPHNSAGDLSKEEHQMMFSDEEDGGNNVAAPESRTCDARRSFDEKT
ncbi:hypothetical protein OS493_037074, partial [Desmophyllum pertusum]